MTIPAGPLSAENARRLERALREVESRHAPTPLFGLAGETSDLSRGGLNLPFRAVISGSVSGTRHAWKRQVPIAAGAWEDFDGSQQGTIDDSPAYESNLDPDVRSGAIVLMQRARFDPDLGWTYVFDKPADSEVYVAKLSGRNVPAMFNTGVDADSVPLGECTDDPHWTVNGVAPKTVVDVNGVWDVADTGLSTWISTVCGGGERTAGTYTFALDFTTDTPADVTLSGRFKCDDGWPPDADGYAEFWLNGVLKQTLFGTFSTGAAWVDFEIIDGFVAGANTLEIKINNDGGQYMGLRVEFDSDSAEAMPGMVGSCPGQGTADVYRLATNNCLELVFKGQQIYNLSPLEIQPGTWFLAIRDYYRQWYAMVPGSGGPGEGGYCDMAALQPSDCLLATKDDGQTVVLFYDTYTGHWVSEEELIYGPPLGTGLGEYNQGRVEFWFADGSLHLSLDGMEMLSCGDGCFSAGSLTGHLTDTFVTCAGDEFKICITCTECVAELCTTDCSQCDGMATEWQFKVSGVLAGTCASGICAALNSTFTLHHRGGCVWTTDETFDISSCPITGVATNPPAYTLYYSAGTGLWTMLAAGDYTVPGAFLASYALSGSFVCSGVNHFDLSGGSAAQCSNYISGIDIVPLAVCAAGDGITVGCCANKVPRLIYATVENDTTDGPSLCSDCPPAVIPLVWNTANLQWEGAGFFCGGGINNLMTIYLRCLGPTGSGCTLFAVNATFPGCNFDPFVSNAEEDCDCLPLRLTFLRWVKDTTGLDTPTCCGGGIGHSQLKITITAT